MNMPQQDTGGRLKCVLINPVQLISLPFGLLYIASVLESKGCSVIVKELPSRHVVDYGSSMSSLLGYLKGERPDLIGITCMSAQCMEVQSIIKAIKENKLPAKIAVGGVHPSFMPEEVMGWGADYVVQNEGEETIAELADAVKYGNDISKVRGIFYRRGDVICHTEKRGVIEDLDKLPLPAYHLVDKRRFTMRKGEIRGLWVAAGWIMTSRGCPSACSFCSTHRMLGKKVRYRGIDHVFKDIKLQVEEYNIDALVVVDDTFTVNKKFVLNFCNRLKKEYPHLIWRCQARVNFFDEDYAKILRESNCIQVDFGVESGSQRILDRLKKGIRVEDTIKAFATCKKYGLRTLATVMVGNPEEELRDLEMTRELLKKIKPNFCAAYYTTPFPGTELYEEAKKNNLIDSSERYWHQYTTPVMLSKIEAKTLKRFLRDFTNLNIVRNYLVNPVFIFDMARFSILNPSLAFRVLAGLLKGHIEEALFLITNSIYFKRQVERKDEFSPALFHKGI